MPPCTRTVGEKSSGSYSDFDVALEGTVAQGQAGAGAQSALQPEKVGWLAMQTSAGTCVSLDLS